MRGSRWMLSVFLLPLTVLAGQPAQPATPNRTAPAPGIRSLVTVKAPSLETASKFCSVPLVEMPIRKDIHFSMKEMPVPDQKKPIDNMPLAPVPAPPCAEPHH